MFLPSSTIDQEDLYSHECKIHKNTVISTALVNNTGYEVVPVHNQIVRIIK